MGTEPPPDDDAWIEKVVEVAGSLGFNKMRLRWKLMRWSENRRKARRRREQWFTHVRYEHKTCPECGAVQDKNEAVCTSCGAKLTRRGLQVLQRIGLTAPQFLSMSTLLAFVILGVYARVWVASGGGIKSPSSQLLIDFGGRWAPVISDEPWRLVTAVFLHAGLLHLGFNLLAIASVGPRIEELYGRLTMLMLFVVTGTLANLGSLAVGLGGVGIGASGGIMGLVGVAAGHGQRQGTSAGRALRNSMLQWAVYTILFGFYVHADNWAHAFGLIVGVAFGYAVRPSVWRHPQMLPVRAIGKLIGGVLAVGAVAIIFTRAPSPPPPPEPDPTELAEEAALTGESRAQFAQEIALCRAYVAGDTAGAVAALRELLADDQPMPEKPVEMVSGLCEWLDGLRTQCHSGDFGVADPPTVRRLSRICTSFADELAKLPGGPPSTAGGSAASANGPTVAPVAGAVPAAPAPPAPPATPASSVERP